MTAEIEPGRKLRALVADEIAGRLAGIEKPLAIEATHKPFVILVAGVNGTGKTTTIGKLAKRFVREGRTVMMAAGDTFRAATRSNSWEYGRDAPRPNSSPPSQAAMRRGWRSGRWKRPGPRKPTF